MFPFRPQRQTVERRRGSNAARASASDKGAAPLRDHWIDVLREALERVPSVGALVFVGGAAVGARAAAVLRALEDHPALWLDRHPCRLALALREAGEPPRRLRPSAAAPRGAAAAVHAVATAWPLETASAQIVVVWPEAAAALRDPRGFDELCRVLVPGGHVLWFGRRASFPGCPQRALAWWDGAGRSPVVPVPQTPLWQLRRSLAWAWWASDAEGFDPFHDVRDRAGCDQRSAERAAGEGPSGRRMATGVAQLNRMMARCCPRWARGQVCWWQRLETPPLRLGRRVLARRRWLAPGSALARWWRRSERPRSARLRS